MIELPEPLRRRGWIFGPLRVLRYRLWRATGISGNRLIAPELTKLVNIVEKPPLVPPQSEGGRRILVFSFRQWKKHAISDALIARALIARGAAVQVFTCGGRLPICDIIPHTLAPPMPCDSCAPYLSSLFSAFGLPLLSMRDLVAEREQDEIREQIMGLSAGELESFEFDGLPLGRLVRSSLQWFLLSGNPEFDREMVRSYRRFLVSGAIVARAAERLLDRSRPDVVYLMNGIFFAERITIELARKRGIPFITHEGGFIPDTFVFTWNDFASYFPLDHAWPERAACPLRPDEERLLDGYLAERAAGRRDVGPMYPKIEAGRHTVAKALDLDLSRPIVTAFTNLDWDTAAFAGTSAFKDMAEWLSATIRYFDGRREQLVIRVHPAEVRLPYFEPRESAVDMIRARFPALPPNVRIVPPDSPLSSYTLMQLSVAGLAYTSTTGMEMALIGKPVITAGRGYYIGRGFTFDARHPDEYADLLERAGSLSLTAEQIELARRYAYLFFFQHHIPFPLMSTQAGKIHFHFDDLESIAPGADKSIDLICDAILNDRPFLYDHTK